MSNSRHWMQTYTGRPFRFDDLENSTISIQDISRPLSRIPRFNGHSSHFISVAEHSIVVSKLLDKWGADQQTQLYGLLHDAHEAFTGDISSPLKRYLRDKFFFNIEATQDAIQFTILTCLDIEPILTPYQMGRVMEADIHALRLERLRFMTSSLEWDIDHVEVDRADASMYQIMHPNYAMEQFEARFNLLKPMAIDA